MLKHVQDWTDRTLEVAWTDLADVAIDDNECILQDWALWKAGTHREEIWQWFDERHSKGVAYLMGVV